MIYPDPQIYRHLKAIFVHIPKTAGTSVENALREDLSATVGGHTTALGFQRKFPEEFACYYKFTFVRHPLNRFLSAYQYLRQFPIHKNLNNQIVHELGTLENFLHWIEERPDHLNQFVHLIPQHQFVCNALGDILVDDVFKFENLDCAWKTICSKLNVKIFPLAATNASRQERINESTMKSLSDFVFISYARDFEIFGYS